MDRDGHLHRSTCANLVEDKPTAVTIHFSLHFGLFCAAHAKAHVIKTPVKRAILGANITNTICATETTDSADIANMASMSQERSIAMCASSAYSHQYPFGSSLTCTTTSTAETGTDPKGPLFSFAPRVYKGKDQLKKNQHWEKQNSDQAKLKHERRRGQTDQLINPLPSAIFHQLWPAQIPLCRSSGSSPFPLANQGPECGELHGLSSACGSFYITRMFSPGCRISRSRGLSAHANPCSPYHQTHSPPSSPLNHRQQPYSTQKQHQMEISTLYFPPCPRPSLAGSH